MMTCDGTWEFLSGTQKVISGIREGRKKTKCWTPSINSKCYDPVYITALFFCNAENFCKNIGIFAANVVWPEAAEKTTAEQAKKSCHISLGPEVYGI